MVLFLSLLAMVALALWRSAAGQWVRVMPAVRVPDASGRGATRQGPRWQQYGEALRGACLAWLQTWRITGTRLVGGASP
jgi:hypothetical protein